MNRRALILNAAMTVTASTGAKGLTHRAVDAQAGLPAGSTSNHFRTRRLLVEAVVERLLERDALLLRSLAEVPHSSPGAFAAEFIIETLETSPENVVVRVALLSDPDAGALRSAREDFLELGAQVGLLADLPRASLRMVLNLVDGTLQDVILYGAPVDRDAVTAAVDGILGSLER